MSHPMSASRPREFLEAGVWPKPTHQDQLPRRSGGRKLEQPLESDLETCMQGLGDLPTPRPSDSRSGNLNERAAWMAHKSRLKTKEGAS